MDLQCLDHVHFSVPDLQQAKRVYGPFLSGPTGAFHFVDDYGGPDVNAYGAWHTSGGDFIQPIDLKKSAFGGPPIPNHGLLSVSFRVEDVDRGIAQAKALGLTVRSRIGSEDIGLGKNVVQAQLLPEPVSGLPFELVEHQLPGEYPSLTEAAVEYVEFALATGVALDEAARALEKVFDSAFEDEEIDSSRRMRTRLHRRLGLRLVAPLDSARRWQSGLHAIAFRCGDLARGVNAAQEAGLEIASRTEQDGSREVDFDPVASVAVRLVESAG